MAGDASPKGRNGAGAVYVIFGSDQPFNQSYDLSALDGSNGFKVSGEMAEDHLSSAEFLGDINGDGIDDFGLGAWRADTLERVDAGKAYVIYGTNSSFAGEFELNTLDGSNGFAIHGAVADDRAGHKVGFAGDVDGDGVNDFLVGALQADPDEKSNAGVTYLIYGQETYPLGIDLASMSTSDGIAIAGLEAGDMSSTRIGSVGDMNGDGFDDFALSAFRADSSEVDSGEAFVIFGVDRSQLSGLNLAQLDGTNGFRISGVSAGGLLGLGLGGGDFNGDGLDDLVVSEKNGMGIDGTVSGHVYVVFGQEEPFPETLNVATMGGVKGLILDGGIAEHLGDSAKSAGDLNGDGFDDITIGASTTSQAYIVFGRDFFEQIDYVGTSSPETIIGSDGDDIIIGGQGDDLIRTLSAVQGDVVRAGQGDDVIQLGESFLGRIVGGRGVDQVQLPGGTSFDLVSLPDNRIVDVESFDLSDAGPNLLRLSNRDVLNLSSESNTITVFGNAADTVVIGTDWSLTGTELIQGDLFRVYNFENAILKVQDETLQLVELLGDFDDDLEYSCSDVDALVNAIANGNVDAAFDMNLDGVVDAEDLTTWLSFAGLVSLPSWNPYLHGDANLDGTVDGQDFLLWNEHKFMNSPAWCHGDFNASGTVDGQDFLIWNSNKFLSAHRLARPDRELSNDKPTEARSDGDASLDKPLVSRAVRQARQQSNDSLKRLFVRTQKTEQKETKLGSLPAWENALGNIEGWS